MGVSKLGLTYLSSKIAAAAGGLIGGLAFMAFLKPKTIMDAAIRGGVSTASGIIGSGVLVEVLNLTNHPEYHLFAGAVIGFLAWGILGLLARVFIKAEYQQSDAIDVVNRARGVDVKKVSKPRARGARKVK